MKITFALFALAAAVIAAPVPQGTYATYGKTPIYSAERNADVTLGDYDDVPTKAPGTYDGYGTLFLSLVLYSR